MAKKKTVSKKTTKKVTVKKAKATVEVPERGTVLTEAQEAKLTKQAEALRAKYDKEQDKRYDKFRKMRDKVEKAHESKIEKIEKQLDSLRDSMYSALSTVDDEESKAEDVSFDDLSRADEIDTVVNESERMRTDVEYAKHKLALKAFNESTKELVMYKKCYYKKKNNQRGQCVVTLAVPKKAKRVMVDCGYGDMSTAKFRVAKAVVVEIVPIKDQYQKTLVKKKLEDCYSGHDNKFIYKVGETVKPKSKFNGNLGSQCESGLHGYLSKDAAIGH